MLLVVDIGNTNTVCGVYDNDKLLASWRMVTDREKTADEYGMLLMSFLDFHKLERNKFNAIVISSVVPPVIRIWNELCQNYFAIKPLWVNHKIAMDIKIAIENPKELGADRIVNAVAAYAIYGGPVIVIDSGTATTFCVVNAEGEYLGGVITAGPGVFANALVERTAKLPRIELVKPESIIGKNTVASMQAGIVCGYIEMVNGIINRIKNELGSDPFVVATGGYAELIGKESNSINAVNQDLTLEGLRLIYLQNR